MKKRKMISLILAAAFSAALFVGCDSMNAETSGENGNTATRQAAATIRSSQ